MPRPIVDEQHLHPDIRDRIANHHADLIRGVSDAISTHAIVVVGMGGNPHVLRARRFLDAAGLKHHDIIIGSYVSQWRRRTALKMWTGWPTFPMVFVRGTLVGGASELKTLIEQGEVRP